MLASLRTPALLSAALVVAGCVAISEEDPRRSRAIYYPEPLPRSAWSPRASDRTGAPPRTEWMAPAGAGGAGVLVFLEGEGTGPEVEPVLGRFSERGYRILRLRIDRLVQPRLDLAVRRPEDIDEVAAALARAVDARLSAVAHAVERELERLDADEPTAPLRPLILGGVGLGACAAPAVAARLGAGGFDAAVLIGGGASLFEVIAADTLETDGVELELGTLTGPQREFLADVYLSESRLDPFHTARFLGGKPVLLVHARFDGVVPHWTGDVLHARLGSPKRLRVLGDHEDLLDELEGRGDWIVTWVEDVVRRVGS